MTILEMHIGVDLLYQKINSNIILSVKPEEKDFLLNNEIFRYINSRTRKKSDSKQLGFEKDIKRYQDIEPLIETQDLAAYVRDNNSVYSYLPSRCFRLLSDRTKVKELCGAPYAPTTTSTNIWYSVYTLQNSTHNNFWLQINGTTVFNIIDSPYPTGVPTAEMKFELIEYMIQGIRAAGFEARYENAIGQFARGGIIIYGPTIFTARYSNNSGGSFTNLSVATIPVTKITPITPDWEAVNDLLPTNRYSLRLNSEFGSTTSDCPISILNGSKLSVFHNKKFIVSSVSIDFIRFPRKVSLPLNQSCDLDPSVHDEIVDNLGKRLAGITSSQQYQQLLRENLTKE